MVSAEFGDLPEDSIDFFFSVVVDETDSDESLWGLTQSVHDLVGVVVTGPNKTSGGAKRVGHGRR